jgi:hypothetical protein
VATETAKFALELEDGISASSESAEDALKSLQAQIDKDSAALTQMKKAMREMQAGGSVDIDAYRKLKSEIDATQDSIGKARAAFVNLGGDFAKLGRKKPPRPPDVGDPKGLADMLSAANALPGPLGQVSKGVGGVRSMVTGLTAAMGVAGAVVLGVVAVLVALVAVLAAVAVATAKATVELLRYAAAQSDAMRSERLRLEGLGTLRRWMRLTSEDAAQMNESINRVAASVALPRSQVAAFGEDLQRMGIRGRAGEDALWSLSTAMAAQGEQGARRLMPLIRMAGHSEKAMADLRARVQKELGGIAAAQMRSLTMISTKLGESFQALFEGVNIEPLLSGLYRLSQLFSQNTESGRALRTILSTVLGVFIGELSATTPTLENLFKDLVILALRATLAFFRIRNAIRDAFGDNILSRMLATEGGMEVVRMALLALTVAVGVLVAGVVVLGAMVFGLLFPFIVIAMAIYGFVRAAEWVIDSFARLRESFSAGAWVSAGRSMIDGVISGLTSGVARLRAAVTSVATDAMSAFRDSLGIHSPSSVFAALGLAIPQGVAEGVERGSSEAEGAVGGMMSTTTNNVSRVQGGPSRAVTVGELHVHVGNEGEGGEDTARRVSDALREFFDNGLATEMP